MKLKNFLFLLILIMITGLFAYGLGRLYFQLTGGFNLNNIKSNFTYQPQWEVRPLTSEEQHVVDKAINQTYRYLGKGCQSYVFVSNDNEYVVKFFKYQRFRLQPWLENFPPLPAIDLYKDEKRKKKWEKLDRFVTSWKVAFEHLKDETGLIYVHLNKTENLHKKLKIIDKIGFEHEVDLDQMEFCIQSKADMLCDYLLDLKGQGKLVEAQGLIDQLLALILSEYHRGLADNDHALMQNTGVSHGKPIHIDVGQFVIDEEVKNPEYYKIELLTKNYKFKNWLMEYYPELGNYLDERLLEIIGPEYVTMQPFWRNKH